VFGWGVFFLFFFFLVSHIGERGDTASLVRASHDGL